MEDMMIKIGMCPNSWGVWFEKNEKQIDWRRYLDEIAEIGYKYTEIGPYSYMSTDPHELKDELDKRNLIPVSGMLMIDIEDDALMETAVEKTINTCTLLKEIRAEYYVLMDDMYTDLITGDKRLPKTLTDEQFKKFCGNYLKLANIAKDLGIKPVFHPHSGTHIETEEQIDKMLAMIPVEDLRICFDTGHHINVKGNDLYAYTEKIGDRIDLLHFKDLNEKIKIQVWENDIPFATATKMNMFSEFGKGQIDWPKYAKTLKEINFAGYAMIEHDCYPVDYSVPKPRHTQTGKFFERIGIGSLR
jgi:inosose dehydratase